MHDMIARRQGPLLGHQRVVGGRDPRRLGDRRAPPPAQAGDGAAAVQPVLHRNKVEQEYARLYEDCGLGLTTWSPLASGLLTGKYRQGIPEGSRGAMENMAFLREGLTSPARNAVVEQLAPIAQELGGSLAQLAIAWATMNPRVSTVILGASRASQLQENLGALALRERLTPELMARIEAITAPVAA
jgi:aryl-alcohol dehydrogenase-like predicted oxidoreductase